MKYSLTLNTDFRILSATFEEYNPDGIIVDTLPNGNIVNYKYINGRYIYEPLPVSTKFELDPGKQYVTFNDLNKALSKGVNSI